MKIVNRLMWYSSAIHQVLETHAPADQAGNVSCRVRSYFREDDGDVTEQDAIREESFEFTDKELTAAAQARGAATWDETDLKAALKAKTGKTIE